jgi:predicted ATPase/class 3 adenylate cyclase
VTFLLTDVEGSTQSWEHHDAHMKEALAQHNSIMREAIAANNGLVFETAGDSFVAAFSVAPDALMAALAAQRDLHAAQWRLPVGRLRVRMALHTGFAEMRPDGYYAQHTLSRLARLLAAAYGDQLLLSLAAHELVRDALPAGVELRDLGEHRLKDLIHPMHIFQVVAAGAPWALPANFPPLKTLDNRPHNLPVQAAPFIGREKEISRVADLLRGAGVRLVTLTGPGGTGKTRLSLQVAAEMLEVADFPDGVYFVELAALSDPALVPAAIAQPLGVAEAPNRHIVENLKDFLKDKRLLLALDNMEQIPEARTTVDALLKSAPGLKILATSRVPLRVYGEKEFPVPSMSLPDIGSLPPLERLTQYEAVRLFIERARDVKPDFEVTNQNAPAVAEICVRLDGLPLAIELAAARVRMLPPSALLSRLQSPQSPLKLLTGGAQSLPARQQTLRNAIEWSYDLLNEAEKQLFRRLAVFRGGCTFEAVEEVCNSPELAKDGGLQVEVLDGLESLVLKSLLQQREGPDGEDYASLHRFWMLETISEFGGEKLDESGETEALRSAHTRFFLRLAESVAQDLRGKSQGVWINRLDADHENLRAALQWAIERGGSGDVEAVETGLRLATALNWFWLGRSSLREGRERLETLISLAESRPVSRRTFAGALYALSGHAWMQGDYAAAAGAAEQALAIGRELGDKRLIARSLGRLGDVTAETASLEESRSYFEQSLVLQRELGNRPGIASCLNNLGTMAHLQGDNTSARALYQESLAITRELGNESQLAASLGNLGNVEFSLGDYPSARSYYSESLRVSKDLGRSYSVAFCLCGLAGVASATAEPHRAARLLGAADTLLELTGAALQIEDRPPYERGIASAREQLGADEYEKAWQEGRAMSLEEAIAYALEES